MTENHEKRDPFVIQEGRLKNGQLNDVYRLSWVEGVYSAGSRRGEIIGRSFNYNILPWVILIFSAFMIILFGRLAYLQVFQGQFFLKMAEGNRIRIERLEAQRGIIYDASRTPIVQNVANFLLYLTPADLPKNALEKEQNLKRIAQILYPLSPHQNFIDQNLANSASTSVAQIYETISQAISEVPARSLESFQPLFVVDNIDYEKAMLLHLESANWKGVTTIIKTRRNYKLPAQSLSHIIGYTGKISATELKKFGQEYLPIDYIGKNGLEAFYESELRGIDGSKQVEVDALGKVKKIVSQTEPVDGKDLVLSLDLRLQAKLEQLLSAQLATLKLKRGSAVVLDPQTGQIKALISLPAYDNNLFARGISSAEYRKLINDPDRPLFARSIAGEFPCGSTIKPVMAAGALNENIIDERTSFQSSGGLRVGQWFFPDWKAGGHGQTAVKKALAESVNTFFYIIGGGYQDLPGLGVDRIVRYLRMFGLGEQTGIDLPGEANGFVPSKAWKESTKGESWYIGDTYHLAIGQGDLTTTPLQIALTTAYFANAGKMMQPRLLAGLLDEQGSYEKIEPTVIKQDIVRSEVTETVRRGMRETVSQGSARSIEAAVPVAVAGKTGTAQWSTKKAPHAWFTGFAPYDDPSLVITVLVEEGKEGSLAATPVAREFLKWYFSAKATTTANGAVKNN